MRYAIIFSAIFSLAFFIYAVFCEPYLLNIKHYKIKNSALSGIKIVFATDFHFANHFFEEWRGLKIIGAINSLKGDIVVLGGDFINGHSNKSAMDLNLISKLLKKIKAPVFAVLGNHDVYYGKKDIQQMLEKTGITVLDNSSARLNIKEKQITFAGVSDYSEDHPDIEKALQNTSRPLVFITHSPDVYPQINEKVDIVLSGHTHGGQVVFPFIGALLIPSDYGQKYRYGLINEKEFPMIVSNGLGTSLLPIRFNCVPEIVVIEFE